jgi:hypothetical protein
MVSLGSQAGLELAILLQPPKCWDYRSTPSHPAFWWNLEETMAVSFGAFFLPRVV